MTRRASASVNDGEHDDHDEQAQGVGDDVPLAAVILPAS
jgi:hypothetical protein